VGLNEALQELQLNEVFHAPELQTKPRANLILKCCKNL
jgi:hypothetical protein